MADKTNLKTWLVISLFLLVALGFFGLPAQAALYSGSGTQQDPYDINTPAKMNDIGNNPGHWGSYFVLTADIDLSAYTGTSFNIIGFSGNPFTGVFDGNGHTISNFTYSSGGWYIGLFGYVRGGAEIKDLGLVNPNVDAGTAMYVGSLVGFLEKADVTGCYAEGVSVSGGDTVGGLVGYNYSGGTMTNCYSTGSVTGGGYTGGLAGNSFRGVITDCHSSCTVSGGSYAGGLAGQGGTISNCYSTGSVSGNSRVGGLVGGGGDISNCYSTAEVTGNTNVGGLVGSGGRISNCYASGSVLGVEYVGGLVGWCRDVVNCYSTASVSGTGSYVGGLVGYGLFRTVNSFWDIQTSGQTTSAEGTGLTTAQMKDANTYLYWGCGLAWTHNAGVDYPRLSWQNLPGELIDTQLSDFVAGAGTEAEPYLIYTAEELNTIGFFWCELDKHFMLMADIDLSAYTGTSFNIIGSCGGGSPGFPFSGVFDGNGHTISNFSYTTTGKYYIGLFGYVAGEGAEVKDLGLINPNVDAGTGDSVGSLVGLLEDATITGCYVEGGSVAGDRDIGGLVGYIGYEGRAIITNCYSTASVSGTDWVGGLAGTLNGTITNCYAMASVSGDYSVGGLVGKNLWWGTINDCYVTGNVWGTTNVGGLVGQNEHGEISNCYSAATVSGDGDVGGLVGENYESTISNCYATGMVLGVDNVGGLVGENYKSTVSNCYSTGSVSGTTNVGGLLGLNDDGWIWYSFWDIQNSGQATSDGGTGKTTAEMQDPNTFLAAGWDFVGEYENGPSDEWAEPPGGGYMILWWQLDPLPPLPTFSGGAGEASDPYLIATVTDLNRIGHNPRLMEAHFKLINDIDLAGIDFFAIANRGHPFTGVFDGNGHTIANFTVDCNDTDYIGLFRLVSGENAQLKDLGLIDPNVDAGTGNYVGSLVGCLTKGAITNCYADGASVSGEGSCDRGVGGLIGSNYATVSNCYSRGDVSGTEWDAGGLIGYNSGEISNCYSAGSVSGDGDVGGLVGHNEGTLHNSYATGNVSGRVFVGGLVGDNLSTITNCYSTGSVSGTETLVGGLAGNNRSTISNCSSSGSVSGLEKVGGMLGGSSGTVINCYSEGDVTAALTFGGLVGLNKGTMTNCYSTGSVTGMGDGGGFVGENAAVIDNCYAVGSVTVLIVNAGGLAGLNSSVLSDCFWDVETTGQSNMCGSGSGCDDGYGKTTAEMQIQSTFTNAGWDFVGESVNGTEDIWSICEGVDYPKLTWQFLIADFDGDDGVDFADFATLALHWLGTDSSFWCGGGGTDLTDDGDVDFNDLKELADNWLTGTIP